MGIKTTAFDIVKMRIISDATLHTNFDTCVNLFQDFMEQCGATHMEPQSLKECQA